MFKELVFSSDASLGDDGYVGGGVWLPESIPWPKSEDGAALVHLIAFPSNWLAGERSSNWISVFIPYEPGDVGHYRKLRMNNGKSQAVVLVYDKGSKLRNEAEGKIEDCGKFVISLSDEDDDDENLASKIDGVDAWLQGALGLAGARRRVSIYGGDLDLSIPNNKGVLSDGMGYLLLSDEFLMGQSEAERGFFLQLG
ncbi:hypothetical protein [Pseudomonas sichuanensis]|uniref:DUF1963 domain-containing protein n=1 Tax=Pseudomonas sichuanensis TaxID=2213015 RepID=A0ABV0DD09_9PSED